MFTAVWVALRTVAAVIAILVVVFLIHFFLRMTGGAGPARGIAARMAGFTIVVRPLMVCGEAVVKRCPGKRIRRMAIRALTGIMICWRLVA